jgi:hypothetical protein
MVLKMVLEIFSDDSKNELLREYDFKNGVRISYRKYKRGILIIEQKFDYKEELRKDEEIKRKY